MVHVVEEKDQEIVGHDYIRNVKERVGEVLNLARKILRNILPCRIFIPFLVPDTQAPGHAGIVSCRDRLV